MNSFELAKDAAARVHSHICNDSCARNSGGYCLDKIRLWNDYRAAALAWNAPAESSSTVNVSHGYL
jgi:hypothetical protein